MSDQYARARKTARKLITKWGKPVTLTRPNFDSASYNPAGGEMTASDTTVSGVGLIKKKSASSASIQGTIEGGTTERAGVRVLLFIPNDGQPAPEVNDFYGSDRITAADPISPDDNPVAIIYFCELET